MFFTEVTALLISKRFITAKRPICDLTMWIITEQIVIKPHIGSIAAEVSETASTSLSVSRKTEWLDLIKVPLYFARIILKVIRLGKICAAQSINPMLLEPKIPAPTVKTAKAGPEFTEQKISFLASLKGNVPFLYSSDIIFAPIGYPPRQDKMKMIIGILYLPNGKTFNIFDPERKQVTTIRGNNEGIITLILNSIPSMAPILALSGLVKINIILIQHDAIIK